MSDKRPLAKRKTAVAYIKTKRAVWRPFDPVARRRWDQVVIEALIQKWNRDAKEAKRARAAKGAA